MDSLSPTPNQHKKTPSSAQFLKNKQFTYLFDNKEDDHVADLMDDDSLRKKQRKGRHNKPRTSMLQVSTTKTQNEQLNAIKKEVEYLQSEVPHFKDIFISTQKQWASSKRNKADIEAFALIQGLTQWIHEYGNVAVTEYDEFKQSAESEILSMAEQIQKLTLEITRLNLLNQDTEHEKQEFMQEIQKKDKLIRKYKKEANHGYDDSINQTTEIHENAINDLEKELVEIREKYKILDEKYERVETYWKMTQSENDDLRNKNYGIEEEVENLKNEIHAKDTNINKITVEHQKTVRNLQLQHQDYAQQMQNEQEKLIMAQHGGNQHSAVGYTMDDDVEYKPYILYTNHISIFYINRMIMILGVALYRMMKMMTLRIWEVS